jgi:hypothetical protein
MSVAFPSSISPCLSTWHIRLAYGNYKTIIKMASVNTVKELNLANTTIPTEPFPGARTASTKVSPSQLKGLEQHHRRPDRMERRRPAAPSTINNHHKRIRCFSNQRKSETDQEKPTPNIFVGKNVIIYGLQSGVLTKASPTTPYEGWHNERTCSIYASLAPLNISTSQKPKGEN